MIMSIRLKYNGMEYAKADHHKINCFINCNACIVCAIKMCVRYHEGYIENKTVGKYNNGDVDCGCCPYVLSASLGDVAPTWYGVVEDERCYSSNQHSCAAEHD